VPPSFRSLPLRRVPAARAAVRALATLALGVLCSGASCRPGGGTTPPKFLGDGSGLDERPDDPSQRDAWDRLQRAREADPGGAEVRAIADELLAGNPPLAVRLAALRARAEHAYLHQDDPVAIASAEEGLGLGREGADGEAQVLVDLARIRARALVRGGDPSTALLALEEPLVQARGGLPPVEALGMRAVATDRKGDTAAAVTAFAGWREALPDGDPTALWAEQRLALLAGSLPPEALAEVVAAMPPSPGRACLQARLGEPMPPGMPPWVAACGTASGGIGILLPRSGPLSAFADEQLAATLATVELIAAAGPPPPLLWRDSGSTTKSAQSAARSLVGDGARVLVGPIGVKNVKAVVGEVGREALVIVPGEGSGKAVGVAPSLEQRVRALVDLARERGRDRLVVLAPDNGYGRRAIEAIEAHATGFSRELVVRTYPPDTTSFGPHVNPVMTALRDDSALLVPDTLARAELVVRQLARAGRMPAHDDVPGLMVLTTAEGLSPQGLSQGHDVLEGVWVAPAAARGPEAQAFETAYARLQGEPPGDQGLLVFYALQQAITGQPGPGAGRTTVTRVQGGRLVVESEKAGR
jgi:ABC-type branched-subunit amino acid transport system substrate-binding protein